MIDTKELREALTRHGVRILNEDEVLELLDRLEAAEKEIASWKGLAKQFGNEADALRTKSAPDGWKLVPIEPTEKMINEGTCASTLPGPRYIDSACAKQCWEYMLAAAIRARGEP